MKRYFAPVKGFFRDYWDYFAAKLSLFISMERGESVLPVPAAATLLRRPCGTTA